MWSRKLGPVTQIRRRGIFQKTEYVPRRISGEISNFFTIDFGGDFVKVEQTEHSQSASRLAHKDVAKNSSIFKLHSEYQPTGDQPQAIEALVKGFREGNQFQTLLGVTGSGKTFTMANVIERLQKPTLVIAHNKTLAGQLYGEFKEFFPENAVEYFVSYYEPIIFPVLFSP